MSTYDLKLSSNPNHPLSWDALRIQFPADNLAVRIYRSLGQRLTEWKYRRALVNLLDYDDHVLADIGMTRGELNMAIELPLTQDAKQAMAKWQAERRITG
ncbi:hypothetical protein GCM10011352_41960 [Marinobacterium zhoushanense]|uniref:DUF1127 domain-containing protein n=1 Tax=Marinobacterium zhoushanense TaxID=1679163 RepID=A0ABQ1KUP3_9GAMM|nr:DUF1127 domain-containing protein [Marinobacterium zhoushanense]GGC11046.1 hypothetical protein GCM10011352_41960 [Marinobacterium zhoushanense]